MRRAPGMDEIQDAGEDADRDCDIALDDGNGRQADDGYAEDEAGKADP